LIALCRLITLFGLREARARAFQCAKLSRVQVISDRLARMPVVPEVMSTHSVRMRADRFSAIDAVDARQVPKPKDCAPYLRKIRERSRRHRYPKQSARAGTKVDDQGRFAQIKGAKAEGLCAMLHNFYCVAFLAVGHIRTASQLPLAGTSAGSVTKRIEFSKGAMQRLLLR
jgi:hypothetical protein